MKSIVKFCLLLLSGIILFSSCRRGDDRGKMIPGDALFAAVINTEDLKDKLSWDEIKQSDWFNRMYNDTATEDWLKKIFDNPDASGIDTQAGFIFFVTKSSDNYDIVFEGKLKNESDFEKFNQNLDRSATLKGEGGVKLYSIKNKTVAGWNDENFVFITSSGALARNLPPQLDSLRDEYLLQETPDANELSARCLKLFSLKKDSSLAQNKIFVNLLKEKGDIHGWMNIEQIVKNTGGMAMVGMFKLDLFFRENISTYTLNFEDGKIDVKQHAYVNKEFTDFLQKYKSDELNTDLLSLIPSQDIIGAGAMNFNPEGLKELIKLTGMDGMLNSFISGLGFNLDDFVNAQNGDIMVAITDLAFTQDSVTIPEESGVIKKRENANGRFIFSAGVRDKQSFQKLIHAGEELNKSMPMKKDRIAYNMNDEYFVMGNNQEIINQFLGGNKNAADFTDRLKGHPVGAYIDFQKILKAISDGSPIRDTSATEVLEASKKLWQNGVFTGGDWDGDAMTAHYEINLVDKQTNSLKQLNQYFNYLSKFASSSKMKMKNFSSDSTMIVTVSSPQ
ncbi:hypothetical protein BH20BAC1_BH20BAC1_18210 [soil metagenome]